jgi:uncharacterized DUF497 family protein
MFEYDPVKSVANQEKHGIDFETAQRLWDDEAGVMIGTVDRGEVRAVRVANIDGRHWTAIYTMRGTAIRVISVRRARDNEVKVYEQANARS